MTDLYEEMSVISDSDKSCSSKLMDSEIKDAFGDAAGWYVGLSNIADLAMYPILVESVGAALAAPPSSAGSVLAAKDAAKAVAAAAKAAEKEAAKAAKEAEKAAAKAAKAAEKAAAKAAKPEGEAKKPGRPKKEATAAASIPLETEIAELRLKMAALQEQCMSLQAKMDIIRAAVAP